MIVHRLNIRNISALALIATLGLHAPAAAHAQSGATAATSATDSLLTAEQLARYVAAKQALSTYYGVTSGSTPDGPVNSALLCRVPAGRAPVRWRL